jgi:hypothetical protein
LAPVFLHLGMELQRNLGGLTCPVKQYRSTTGRISWVLLALPK